ncbi:SGNH/GDSL hydrolase family protein [Sphingomonas xinjiangensis]|uniref:Lysophospholipase L1-like esterase n=1 Tax=Sphingomonas xinjiangensis TaxID=643568 RepID=A0A840YQJ7_9SPHN|nr:SGNH/GDSL hydrolase family protein [Sphingomonas xinjiangensis]MBB5711012.1 lysophospholipase L1-like esterase [Sphingomonas xinjiangensis]
MRSSHIGALIAALLASCPAWAGERWVASWGSAQMIPLDENALPAARASDVTLRQVVRLSVGGKRLRVRFSNAFGTAPLVIGAAYLGRQAAPGGVALVKGSSHSLSFAGQRSITIPAGAEIYSDPISMAVAPGGDLAVSLYLPTAPAVQTGHPGSRATSFLIAGNRAADDAPAGAEPSPRWWALADIEVEAPDDSAAVVAIGDSITDGYGVKPDTHGRWTDAFAARLRADPATRGIGVVNAGIGGNRILLDGSGPNLIARFDRDVIARSGVRWAILLEGTNDLGMLTRDAPATPAAHAAIVTQLIQAYSQVAARAHAHGIKLIGGTITPFGGNEYYHPGPALEAARQAVNHFIRTSGQFDAVIDFDKILRDPARPNRLNPAYDSGDHLHPSMAGYRAMGQAVPLALFKKH